jgi:uncharacterized protein (PEP-CTERM system associated)
MSTATELDTTARLFVPRTPVLRLLGAAVGGAALQLTPVAAAAQKLKLDLSLESQVVASSNAARAPGGRNDLILDLLPSVKLRGDGGRLKLDMKVGVISRTYLQGTQPNRAEPQIDVRSTAQVVEGWLTLDAHANVTRVSTDPFAARADDASDLAVNYYRQYKASIAPRLKRDLSHEWELQAQSEHGWLRNNDPDALVGARETTHTEESSLRVARRPVPLGVAAEVRRQRQLNDAAARDGTVLALDSARLSASYRFDASLVAGVTVGRERSAYLSRDDEDSIVGFNVEWMPTERTWLRGTAEKRFFGQAFDLGFVHRSPYLALSGAWSRQPGTAFTSLGMGAAGSSVAGLLDSLLITRIPNPIDRATAVNRLITERGLPTSFSRATEVVDQTPQLVQSGQVSLVLLGVRHSVALGLYSRSARELRRDGDISLGLSASDFRQVGATLVASRRLTPTMTFSLALERSLTDGLAATAGDYARETKAKAELGVALAPRTQATFGIGRDLVRSNRTGNFEDTRAFVGLLQNF